VVELQMLQTTQTATKQTQESSPTTTTSNNKPKRKWSTTNLKTIAISKARYLELREFGRTAESFDMVIGRLLDRINEKEKEEKGTSRRNDDISPP
jgi:predicted CopG family antitoxin